MNLHRSRCQFLHRLRGNTGIWNGTKQTNRYTAMVKVKPIPIVILVGVAVLFFFPSPESNFFAYLGTALFFVLLVIFLLKWNRRKK